MSACPRGALDDPQRVPLSLRERARTTRWLAASANEGADSEFCALSPCDSRSVHTARPPRGLYSHGAHR